jgi:DNA polymerase I-like protein with 3'-5' exonuclease and polymerase domains
VNKKLIYAYENIETPLIPVLAKMESNGVRFIGQDGDEKQCLINQWSDLVLAKQDMILQQIRHYVRENVSAEAALKISGPSFFNSPDKLAKLFFDDMQLRYKNKGSSRSTNKEVLDKLSTEYPYIPIFKQIKLWRSLENLRTKHLRCFCYEHVTIDPKTGIRKIYAQQMNTASVTGRLAVINPNLQNIPHPVEFEHPEPTSAMIRQSMK